MKVFTAILACLAAVSAQSISIGAPSNGATLVAGQQTVVEVDRPDTLSSSQEVALVIGISPCTPTLCLPPSESMGQILYSGGYDPQFDVPGDDKPPHQNFTVTVPSNLPKGPATLGVAHFFLLGASLGPTLETRNVSVIIQ